MVSYKHIRWCAPLLNGARGRGFSTQSLEGMSGDLLEALESHVKDAGKPLLSILRKSICAERECLKEQRDHLLQLLETEKERLKEQREHLLLEKEKERELFKQQEKTLEKESELRARWHIDFLRARGLNDIRGLVQYIQEELVAKSNITSRLKGALLWEGILKANAGLATCIQKCTNVPTTDLAKQALTCYNVFSVLSQHIDAGKSLAELQAALGGTIMFERGPLSLEQVRVLLCMRAAVHVTLQENMQSQTRFY